MDKILVPTDFSQQAEFALDAAVQIAKKSNAEIDLLHVLYYPISYDISRVEEVYESSIYPDEAEAVRNEAMEKLKEISERNAYDKVKINYNIKYGNPYTSIAKDVYENDVDMVVMGSKGSSGIEEIFVGSNTERMVRFSKVPVLTIKDKVDLSNIQDIVFATSLKDEEEKIVKELKKFQAIFNATIHLLKVNTRGNFIPDVFTKKQVKAFVDKYQIENYTINIFNDENEEDGIVHFSEEIDADVIALATHSHSGLLHLITGSIAEDIVNHGKRPLWTMSLKA